jgi:large subunit ribosomal protein L13
MKLASKTTLLKTADLHPEWHVIDATDRVLGRLAARIARVLMGKHKPTYTPHMPCGDFVVVLNAGKIKVTGDKQNEIVYNRYSGYPGGLKSILMKDMLQRHPERVLRAAVQRMLPKSKLGRGMLLKLKLYTGETHPHQAQQPKALAL